MLISRCRCTEFSGISCVTCGDGRNSAPQTAVLEEFGLARDGDMAILSDDRDRDQFPDSWELTHFSSITSTAGGPTEDWDHDGSSDLHEYLAGTVPTDPSNYLAIQTLGLTLVPNRMTFSWSSVAGHLYTVSIARDLCGAFTNAVDCIDSPGTGGTMIFTDPEAVHNTRFHRHRAGGDWEEFLPNLDSIHLQGKNAH